MEIGVDAAHKQQSWIEAHSAEHDKEEISCSCHVAERKLRFEAKKKKKYLPKEERGLQEASHARAIDEIKARVEENKESCGASRDEWAPPPVIVLHRELEISQRDSDARCHDDEDDCNEKQDAEEGRPKGVRINER